MQYAEVIPFEVCNGLGIGTSFFVQGCDLRCDGCFNKIAWDFNGGKEWNDEKKQMFFNVVSKYYIKRVSFLGGEPFSYQNAHDVCDLIKETRDMFPNKKIWVFSGYTMQQLQSRDDVRDVLNDYVDVLVDGKFMIGMKKTGIKFRGSSNQKVWVKHNEVWVDQTDIIG